MTEKLDFKTALTAVKTAYDIADYMRAAGITLKSNGVGKWKTNCPFHQDKTPSLIVNEAFQNYKCWGCGATGDLINFVMNYENVSFVEALTKLAEEKGITLTLSEDARGTDFKSLQKILQSAANFYCQQFDKLPPEHVARTEITARGLTYDNRKPDWLRYGYSPGGNALYKLLTHQGFTDELILESGLCRKSDRGELFDFFRSRLMFIFTDRYNKPVGFSSRKLFDDDTRGKYVNSSESPLFHKSSVLYNHVLARKAASPAKMLYVVEGQFDVAAFVEAGALNVVASSGTAFTQDHVNECRKMVGVGGKLVFCFDGDAAGFKAAAKIFLDFPDIHDEAYVITFPNGSDPCDYRLANGNKQLIKFVQKPVTLVEFMIYKAKEGHDLSSVVGRANYVEEAARIVKTVKSLTLRDNCIRLLSLESLTPVNVVREAVIAATPMVFDEKPREDKSVDESLQSDENTEQASEKLKELVAKDRYHNIAARFVNLGLMRKSWRQSVVRSQDVLPKAFHPLLAELERLKDEEVVFPEMFEDSETASFLMGDEFSAFYRFMGLEELKGHFIYLHGVLKRYVNDKKRERVQARLLELLKSEDSDNIEYFKGLLEKAAGALV